MLRRLASFAVFAGLALTATHAVAGDQSSGCGPGYYLFKENTILSSSLRSTTHGFLFPTVTFGMTSGTSNCAKHNLVDEKMERVHFLTANGDVLRHDAARGDGAFLHGLFLTYGCNPLFERHFGHVMQEQFDAVFLGSDTPSNVEAAASRAIRDDRVLADHCAAA
jgi:hypothetical protein